MRKPKPVTNITTGEKYASAAEAADKMKCNKSSILKVIYGARYQVKGCRFTYTDPSDINSYTNLFKLNQKRRNNYIKKDTLKNINKDINEGAEEGL